MTTTTFTEKTVHRGHTSLTEITREVTPGSISELRAVRGRWWDYVGDAVSAVNRVKVSFRSIYEGSSYSEVRSEEYIEVITPQGKGVVVFFDAGPEMEGFVPNKGKALIYGCWKKYGRYRGHAVGYFRSLKLSPDSKAKVYHTCPAHIYDAAVGGNKYPTV